MFKSLTLMATVALGALLPAVAFAEDINIKLWTLADKNAPGRVTNIEAAAGIINAQFKAAGIDKRVVIDINNSAVQGWDSFALDTLKAFSVGQGPDIYILPHEWIGQFAQDGYAMPMEDKIAAAPWVYGDILPVLWNSAKVDAGEFTLDDLTALSKEVVDGKAAQYGMLHRPNVGIDYLMVFQSYGVKFMDEKTGKLMFPKAEMAKALGWYERNAKEGVTPVDNTAMSWEAIQTAFKQEKAFIFHQGVWAVAWQVGDKNGATWPTDGKGYFNKIGWISAPAAEKGGKPANLSHPLLYTLNPKSANADIAADLVALATLPHFNNEHAVTSYHTAISNAQTAMPKYRDNWVLSAASPMMKYAQFVPNHTKFGSYNKVLFSGLQAVETGKMTAAQAVDFIADELELQFGAEIEIRDAASN
ncbi:MULTISPECIES: ABC transporter substrate-binding protein [unclassified Rhizobium]|uniref:ABC transporter substrate-binding protein n=1 Tax=unclassified Rhizobium TaxID=2613769 RepID=UPI000BC931D1|nr:MULTISPECIES: sugar ABC transporter substrate-binding protein [unclassified Rhizobium]MDH7807706.1 inositol-phosphate transport system substrate-binding protein [Rhizobium sp. AN67]MDQ4405833.1 sugar ABC transporter substrate-binding protein [Rhizobium sp. AN63]SOD53250.1 inositol-phosphate transport system substrate-binding protein [Rhizobium sp. AN6A]